ALRNLPPFPTRRSSDLTPSLLGAAADHRLPLPAAAIEPFAFALAAALDVNVGATSAQAILQVPGEWLQTVAADLRSHSRTALVRSEEHTSELQSLAYLV